MKLVIKKDVVTTINNLLLNAKINYGYTSWEGKRVVCYKGNASNLHFDSNSKKWVLSYQGNTMNFRDFLSALSLGRIYTTSSKQLKELAKVYTTCNKTNDEQKFDDYLDALGQKSFNIKDVKIYDDEVEWLKDHVTKITARFPSKYKKDFQKNFPNAEHTICDKCWNYAFTMYFDTMEDIPDSLLTTSNSLGNTLDYDKKKMCNTSYIWKLLKNYDTFNFGKRDIQNIRKDKSYC